MRFLDDLFRLHSTASQQIHGAEMFCKLMVVIACVLSLSIVDQR
jgi:hypothetical protein